ncbi:unnamed protein product [Vitrella brassicaformis CCMP3155]|uniref:Peptidase M48 domain-containing protein n=1 Tax=Vitrella brassicaformis (strain CCMP3155) TaxID=1169540 RepID=A0A0G4ED75_VITBC|nr:unnamed protein product [Vitrella brassicaformis CCMP3155]|eukprot:CEL93300.1 unnamed protein product [Vitrella brassicaformis CCMP3155]
MAVQSRILAVAVTVASLCVSLSKAAVLEQDSRRREAVVTSLLVDGVDAYCSQLQADECGASQVCDVVDDGGCLSQMNIYELSTRGISDALGDLMAAEADADQEQEEESGWDALSLVDSMQQFLGVTPGATAPVRQPSRRRYASRLARLSASATAAIATQETAALPSSPSVSSLPLPEDGRVKFPFLKAERFQHPLDVQASRQVRAVRGVEQGIRFLFSAVLEDVLLLDNLSSSVKVSAKQMPRLHALLKEACEILDMKDMPDLYVRQNPQPNAYTVAIQGRRPFIVVHSSLVDLMTPAEVQTVLAHELGHLKCEHGIFALSSGLLQLILDSLGGRVGRRLAAALELATLRWSRAAEFSCDRAALLVAQDVRVVVSTFLKLVGGSASMSNELDVDEFLAQAKALDELERAPLIRLFREAVALRSTHPLPVLRAQELERWSREAQYQGLLNRGVPFTTATADVPTS